MASKKTFLVILAVTVIILAIIVSLNPNFSNQKDNSVTDRSIEMVTNESNLPPSPFPFQELTIPFLRNKTYQSNLGELMQVESNSNYTSYLTSYDSDGLKINSLLTIPEGEAPTGGWPAVIFLHGYIPPQNYQTQKNYLAYVDYLAKNSLVVLKIDYRGHGNSEGDATGAYYSGDYIVDTLNAYSALENTEFVDKSKIYLWGHSMSGNIVLRSLAVQPSIPKAVIWAGAVYTYDDFQNFRISDSSYQPPESRTEHSRNRQELRDTYGDFNPENWFWKQVPATNYLSEIRGKIQIHHAVDDTTVDIGYSRNLNTILNQTDIIHELFEYQSGGHNISGASFNQAMNRTVEFLKTF
ncbi:MAG: alpha/beta fold hydrolase [Pseudomonadales bacterium]|nr:alpha/beta fold hydrolase [Pseudomonadales bacterium]